MTVPFPTRQQEEWRYAELDALSAIWNRVAEPLIITVGAGERFEQSWICGADEVDVRRVELTVGEDASAQVFALSAARVYGRLDLNVTLARGSTFELFAANIGGGRSNNEVVTTITHLGHAARSRQVVRSVLNDQAIGSYLGKVEVRREAQKTDAEQSVKAMLLHRGATANCKPELEIFADDVKCAHGASVGELDPQQLFYAEARGLDPASARALLLEGFVMGLFEQAGDPSDIADAAREAMRSIV